MLKSYGILLTYIFHMFGVEFKGPRNIIHCQKCTTKYIVMLLKRRRDKAGGDIGEKVHLAFDSGIEGYELGAGGNVEVIDGRIDVHQAISVIKKKNQITQMFVEFNRKKRNTMRK